MALTFLSGHRLSEALYEGFIAPLMQLDFPSVPYAAALIGSGSDVIGYDTEQSMDHDWGPRLNIVLAEEDIATYRDDILSAVESTLPETLYGIPIDHKGSRQQQTGDAVTFNNSMGVTRPHGVMIHGLSGLLNSVIGIEDVSALDIATWLSTPQQALLEFTAGPLFRDDTGQLTSMRAALAWFPDDLWYYLMAAQWQRIAQLEALIGRTGEVLDDLGSQVITISIIRDVMRLALLQQRQYAPYAKWLGSAFARLAIAEQLDVPLSTARFARAWKEREAAMLQILASLGRQQDMLGLTPPVNAQPRSFRGRPYQVVGADQYSTALHEAMTDPVIKKLPFDFGSIDTLSDSTLGVSNPSFRTALASWFRTSVTL